MTSTWLRFVAVARTVASLTPLPVPLAGILQPLEEVGESGAHDVVRAGVLEAHQVGAVIGDTCSRRRIPWPIPALRDQLMPRLTNSNW